MSKSNRGNNRINTRSSPSPNTKLKVSTLRNIAHGKPDRTEISGDGRDQLRSEKWHIDEDFVCHVEYTTNSGRHTKGPVGAVAGAFVSPGGYFTLVIPDPRQSYDTGKKYFCFGAENWHPYKKITQKQLYNKLNTTLQLKDFCDIINKTLNAWKDENLGSEAESRGNSARSSPALGGNMQPHSNAGFTYSLDNTDNLDEVEFGTSLQPLPKNCADLDIPGTLSSSSHSSAGSSPTASPVTPSRAPTQPLDEMSLLNYDGTLNSSSESPDVSVDPHKDSAALNKEAATVPRANSQTKLNFPDGKPSSSKKTSSSDATSSSSSSSAPASSSKHRSSSDGSKQPDEQKSSKASKKDKNLAQKPLRKPSSGGEEKKSAPKRKPKRKHSESEDDDDDESSEEEDEEADENLKKGLKRQKREAEKKAAEKKERLKAYKNASSLPAENLATGTVDIDAAKEPTDVQKYALLMRKCVDEWQAGPPVPDQPIDRLILATDELRPRKVNRSHVKNLIESFLTNVVRETPLKAVVFADRAPGKQLWSLKEGKKVYNWDVILQLKPQVFDGNHRLTALKQLCSDFPNAAEYKTFPVQFYICPSSSHSNLNALQAVGVNCNVVAGNQLKVQWSESVYNLHRESLEMRKEQNLLHDWSQRPQKASQVLGRYATMYQRTVNSLSVDWQLANLPPSVWEHLVKILDGDVSAPQSKNKKSAFQVPSANTHFRSFCTLPNNEEKELMLRQVINGSITLQQMHGQCQVRNRVHLIREKILDALKSLDPQLSTWERAKKSPFCCGFVTDAFVLGWAATYESSKEKKGSDKTETVTKLQGSVKDMYETAKAAFDSRARGGASDDPEPADEFSQRTLDGLTVRCIKKDVFEGLKSDLKKSDKYAMFIADVPQNIVADKATWDTKAWGHDEFLSLLNLINVTTDHKCPIAVFFVTIDQYADLKIAAAAAHWASLSVVVWHKPDAVSDGGHRFTSAHELIIFAFKNSPRDATWNMSARSWERQNVVRHKAVRHPIQAPDQKVVNPTQKPEALIGDFLIKQHTKPGEIVVSICGGSGTDAVAALSAGRSVVLFENDKRQYRCICSRVQDRVNRLDTVTEKRQQDIQEGKEEPSDVAAASVQCVNCQEDSAGDISNCDRCAKPVHVNATDCRFIQYDASGCPVGLYCSENCCKNIPAPSDSPEADDEQPESKESDS